MALVAPTVTGYSGFWNSVGPSGASGAGPYAPKFYRSGEEYRAGVMLGRRGFRKWRAVMRNLNNNNPGATTTDSYSRVQSGQAMYDAQYGGGKRTLQVVNNAVTTTSAMQTAINTRVYDWTVNSQSYPVDASGNGGGGKKGR
jgi:hypothetical protein